MSYDPKRPFASFTPAFKPVSGTKVESDAAYTLRTILNKFHDAHGLDETRRLIQKAITDIDKKTEEITKLAHDITQLERIKPFYNRYGWDFGWPVDTADGMDQAAMFWACLAHDDAELAYSDANIKLPGMNTFGLHDILPWAEAWRECAFPRLSMDAKTAAALMVSDIPEDLSVPAPWPYWMLVVPDGLYQIQDPDGNIYVQVALIEDPTKAADRRSLGKGFLTLRRVLCAGTRQVGFLWELTREEVPVQFLYTSKHTGVAKSLDNYVRGACLALSPKDRETVTKNFGSKSVKHKKKYPRKGQTHPRIVGNDFRVSKAVNVDLRHLVATSNNYNASAEQQDSARHLSVTFMVRGHWRQQPYGPNRSQRKVIWVEPFWKGPEDARTLLRGHQIKNTD